MLVYIIVQTIVGGNDMQKRRLMLLTITVGITILLTGCFQGEQSMGDEEKIDPPKDAEAVDDLEKATDAEKATSEEAKGDEKTETDTVARQLFLIDSNGMVAPQTMELPSLESKEVATQSLEYLVKNGPVTSLLPNGFKAVLPAGTEILSVNLKDNGTIIVNVSDEFKNYKAKSELEILQSMTYTLTQFDSVDKMKLRINGEPQKEMPVNGTPIGEGYSREDGINVVNSDSIDLMASKPVTLYFPTAQGDNQYFVPVTQYINVEKNDLYGSVVNALMEGPGFNSNVQQVFNGQAKLVNNPSLNSGVLKLVFNQGVLKESEKAVISDKVMETLVRTLTNDKAVKALKVEVKNVDTLYNENGKPYSKPVTTEMFQPAKKL